MLHRCLTRPRQPFTFHCAERPPQHFFYPESIALILWPQPANLSKTEILSGTDDDVIQEWNLQELADQIEPPRQTEIELARIWTAARVIMCDDYAVSAICDCGAKNFARMYDRFIDRAKTDEAKVFNLNLVSREKQKQCSLSS